MSAKFSGRNFDVVILGVMVHVKTQVPPLTMKQP